MRVTVLFGGRSPEHEVSVRSARTVARALSALGHEWQGVGVTLTGRWVEADPFAADRVPEGAPPHTAQLDGGSGWGDVVFPVLHGPAGEDGTVQGVLETAGVAFVGSGVEGSVVGCNKVLHKKLFAASGIPVVAFTSFDRSEWDAAPASCLESAAGLGFPSFVKPARLGSSVGISKCASPNELEPAVMRAFRQDDLVLVESAAGPRELEVGVAAASDGLRLSAIGEIIAANDFYDYEAKYLDDTSKLEVPASIPAAVETSVQGLARKAFSVCGCEGLARVDFLWDGADGLFVNEINSLPGMTQASLYSQDVAWSSEGGFAAVVRILLDDAVRRRDHRLAVQQARLSAHAEETSG